MDLTSDNHISGKHPARLFLTICNQLEPGFAILFGKTDILLNMGTISRTFHRATLSLVVLWSQGALADVAFDVCYDFGCRHQIEVALNAKEWKSVAMILDAEKASVERKQIKLAVARMEYLAGLYSPIHRDVARNLPVNTDTSSPSLFPGQLDCIDESINTTRYLELFERAGLLKFHRVAERAYRRSFFDQHWAAQLEELETNQHYVIDSWFRDNGEPPILVTRERWKDLSR